MGLWFSGLLKCLHRAEIVVASKTDARAVAYDIVCMRVYSNVSKFFWRIDGILPMKIENHTSGTRQERQPKKQPKKQPNSIQNGVGGTPNGVGGTPNPPKIEPKSKKMR